MAKWWHGRDGLKPCPDCNDKGNSGTCGDWDCGLCTFDDCATCGGSGWLHEDDDDDN